MSKEGFVYILTNKSFKDDWVKIGKSGRPVDIRSKELDNTAVPLPFEIYATLKTSKYEQVEKLVHKTIDRLTDLRIRQNREFFNIEPSLALDIFKDIATTLDDAEIKVYEQTKDESSDEKVDAKNKKRPRLKFSLLGIKVGEELTFIPTGVKVTVATDDKVEYDGRLYQLSPFVGTFLPEDKQNDSGCYQGAKFFRYKGKVLTDLRNEIECNGGCVK